MLILILILIIDQFTHIAANAMLTDSTDIWQEWRGLFNSRVNEPLGQKEIHVSTLCRVNEPLEGTRKSMSFGRVFPNP